MLTPDSGRTGCGVLQAQHDRAGAHALLGTADMRIEDRPGVDAFGIEEAVGGLCLGPAVAGRRNAIGRGGRHAFGEQECSRVQALVAESFHVPMLPDTWQQDVAQER